MFVIGCKFTYNLFFNPNLFSCLTFTTYICNQIHKIHMAYSRIKKDGTPAQRAGRPRVSNEVKRIPFHGMAERRDIETIGVENISLEASRLVKELASKLRKQATKT